MSGYIEPVQYTSAADMMAAHAATRARLMGKPPAKRYTPAPVVVIEKPKTEPKITETWTAMTPAQKCELVRYHWYEGISTTELARLVSKALGEPISRRVIVGLYYRNNERLLRGINFTARGGGVVGVPRPRKTWEPNAEVAKKQRDRLRALLRSPDSSAEDVILAASEWQRYSVKDIKGYTKYDEVSTARQTVMWLLKKFLQKNAVEIGNSLDGRCHTTIAHGIARINKLISKGDKRVSGLVELTRGLLDD